MTEINKKLSDIKEHWNEWANQYGESLRATTKSSNIKKLEIKAIVDSLNQLFEDEIDILEVGCGNGFNAISIAESSNHNVDAFDYIPEMIESANSNKSKLEFDVSERLNFYVGDVLNLDKRKKYDLVYSCRCLINLPDFDLQKKAIISILDIIKPNGLFFMIENFSDNHQSQNNLRSSVGLVEREVAGFNNFFESKSLFEFLSDNGCKVEKTINFASLHDIAQYILVPMLNDGELNYEDDVVVAITNLLLSLDLETTYYKKTLR